MKDFKSIINSISAREEFLLFLERLIKDFKTNPNEWENDRIDLYLESMMSWIEDMDGYYVNNALPIPQNIDWRLFASILLAAKMYE